MKVKDLIKQLEEHANQDAEVKVSVTLELKEMDEPIPAMTGVSNLLKPEDENDESMVILGTDPIEEDL